MTRRRFLDRGLRCAAVAVFGTPGLSRAWAETPEIARAWRAMGTLIEVRIPDLPRAEAVEAIRRVRRRVELLEAALTLYRKESPLVAFNRAAPGTWVGVPVSLGEAVRAAVVAAEETGSAFDPTVAPMMRGWGLYHPGRQVPGAAAIRALRTRPGVAAIEMDPGGDRMRRLDARVEIDMGGIGKGIAVDAALQVLAAAGSGAALVNLGGGIGVLGAPPGSPRGWPVGINHPRRPGEVLAELHLSAGHIATSGDYERWVDTPHGRKHHLLDPATGEPTAGIPSLTAWARSGLEADVASTAALVQTARTGEPDCTDAYVAVKERSAGLVKVTGKGWNLA